MRCNEYIKNPTVGLMTIPYHREAMGNFHPNTNNMKVIPSLMINSLVSFLGYKGHHASLFLAGNKNKKQQLQKRDYQHGTSHKSVLIIFSNSAWNPSQKTTWFRMICIGYPWIFVDFRRTTWLKPEICLSITLRYPNFNIEPILTMFFSRLPSNFDVFLFELQRVGSMIGWLLGGTH